MILIDGDVIAYRAAFATEKTRYLVLGDGSSYATFDNAKDAKAEAGKDGEIWSRKDLQPFDTAAMIASQMIKDIRARFTNTKCHVFLSPDTGNFRDKLATRAKYKGERGAKPTHLKELRGYLKDKFKATIAEGCEADDYIGIAATKYGDKSIIASIDKDLKQLPGLHYNFVTKDETKVTKKQAVLNFYAQVIAGDATDNIPGLEGVGEVTARKMLAKCKNAWECWSVAVKAYNDKYGESGFHFALETARLVYIARTVDDIQNLWCPPA